MGSEQREEKNETAERPSRKEKILGALSSMPAEREDPDVENRGQIEGDEDGRDQRALPSFRIVLVEMGRPDEAAQEQHQPGARKRISRVVKDSRGEKTESKGACSSPEKVVLVEYVKETDQEGQRKGSHAHVEITGVSPLS
jgi:hypothetical protein